MKDLKAIRGQRQLQELIDQGEHTHQDFKYLISDARKIARSISAFANNDGGRLLIGVKDNGTIAGVRNEEDLYMIEQAAQRYCRPAGDVTFTAIKARGGLVVFIAHIPRAGSRPIEVIESATTRQAYYRVNDQNITAHPLMVATWRYNATARHGTLITSTSPESAILSHLNTIAPTGTTGQSIAAACHLSQQATDSAIVRLAAIGLIDFVYDGHQFVIALPADTQQLND